MLIRCPECELNVSDKALACPHCGYPIKPQARRSSNRKKRLPNGFGQITELKGRNLRKPFRAMITVGKTDEGRPIQKLLKPVSYFATYNEAYGALVDYNRNPYDLAKDITVDQLFDRWIDNYAIKHPPEVVRGTRRAFQYCHSIYGIKVRDIRARHLKGCIESAYAKEEDGSKTIASPITKGRIKTLFNFMFDYAVEYEVCDKNYARDFNITENIKERKAAEKSHLTFTEEEMAKLWENITNPWVSIILIHCYTGWRPNELCSLKLENINLDDWTMTGGSKTEAGKNRVVPIHSKIRGFVLDKYNESVAAGNEFFLKFPKNIGVKEVTYFRYRDAFTQVCKDLGFREGHKLHDCRKQFVTMAKKYNVDEYAIKYIVGHEIKDITERTYTEREFDWLRSEIEKIR